MDKKKKNECRDKLYFIKRILLNENFHNLDTKFNLKLSEETKKGRRFYANFLNRMKTTYTNDIPSAGVSITDTINLYVNPEFFLGLTTSQQIEVLIHECEHLARFHPQRAKKLHNIDHKLFNVAADALINQPLPSLHEFGITVEKLNKELKLAIPQDSITEEIYNSLKQAKKEHQKNNGGDDGKLGDMDSLDDHSTWSEMDEVGEDLAKNTLIGNMEKAVKSAGAGNTPSHILKELSDLKKSNVNWKQILRRFVHKLSMNKKVKTRMKRNRRYGTLFQGRKKEPSLNLTAIIDESGSVCEKQFKQFWSEMEKIMPIVAKLTVIHFDSQVNSVYEYKKDIKFKRTGCGGTLFQPAFDKANEIASDGVIFFTDGYPCDSGVEKPKYPVLWASTDREERPYDWGSFLKVKIAQDE